MISFEMPEDYLKELTSKKFEDVAEKMLNKASPILVNTTKKAMRDAVSHSGESEMINSVKATKPKKTKTDAMIVNVNPTGYGSNTYNKGKRKYPVSNSLKALWLQYGVAGRQPPRDWLSKSINNAEAEVTKTLQDTWEDEVGGHK